MEYFIYKTTNTLNNKIYIGVHSERRKKENYIGSGVDLKKDIKKIGKKYFKKEVLFCFDNPEEAILKERELVNKDFVKRTDTYNKVLGGSWKKLSDKTKSKISNALKGRKHTDAQRKINSEAQKEWNKKNKPIRKGAKHSSETIEKIRLQKLGKPSKKRRRIINNATGVIFESVTEALIKEKINTKALYRMLKENKKYSYYGR